MQPILLELAEPIRHAGRRQFANWSDSAFQAWLAEPGERLCQALGKEPASLQRPTINGFLRLVHEGIGLGYLGDCSGRSRGLLDAILREQVPEWLAATHWFTYFYNAIAARAFMLLDVAELQRVDDQRRTWVADWLAARDLPSVPSGTYYVKSFRAADLPPYFAPLQRGDFVRLCFQPPNS